MFDTQLHEIIQLCRACWTSRIYRCCDYTARNLLFQ